MTADGRLPLIASMAVRRNRKQIEIFYVWDIRCSYLCVTFVVIFRRLFVSLNINFV
jgi:hypothetical protein